MIRCVGYLPKVRTSMIPYSTLRRKPHTLTSFPPQWAQLTIFASHWSKKAFPVRLLFFEIEENDDYLERRRRAARPNRLLVTTLVVGVSVRYSRGYDKLVALKSMVSLFATSIDDSFFRRMKKEFIAKWQLSSVPTFARSSALGIYPWLSAVKYFTFLMFFPGILLSSSVCGSGI